MKGGRRKSTVSMNAGKYEAPVDDQRKTICAVGKNGPGKQAVGGQRRKIALGRRENVAAFD